MMTTEIPTFFRFVCSSSVDYLKQISLITIELKNVVIKFIPEMRFLSVQRHQQMPHPKSAISDKMSLMASTSLAVLVICICSTIGSTTGVADVLVSSRVV